MHIPQVYVPRWEYVSANSLLGQVMDVMKDDFGLVLSVDQAQERLGRSTSHSNHKSSRPDQTRSIVGGCLSRPVTWKGPKSAHL